MRPAQRPTVPAIQTPAAMEELHERFAEARISRLLTLLLLYQSGYEVGRFISLERLIDQSRATYYEALGLAGLGRHEDEHDVKPWLDYFLGILIAANRELTQRTDTISTGRGARREAIIQFIDDTIAAEFTVADVRRAVPTASRSYIDKTLARLRDEGRIEPTGVGRGARWRRLPSS